MGEIDSDQIRTSLLQWKRSLNTDRKGILRLKASKKRTELFTTFPVHWRREIKKSDTTLKRVYNFIREHLQDIVKPEDLAPESEMFRTLEEIDFRVTKEKTPSKQHLKEFAKDIRAQFLHQEMLTDLQQTLESERPKSTIDGIINLYLHRHEIAIISDEIERNKLIQSLTQLLPEQGFCVGPTYEERLENIEGKFNLLINSYYDAKKTGSLIKYFAEVFVGDSCFNGRIIALVNYIAAETLHIEAETLIPNIPDKDLNDLFEIYFAYRESVGEKTAPSKLGFLRYLQSSEEGRKFENYYTNDQLFSKIYQHLTTAYL